MSDNMGTDPLNLGGEGDELNRGIGSVLDSNFLCSEYDGREDHATNETNSCEWDHSCNTGDVIADEKYLDEVDTFDIDGIQGRHIVEYYEQRRSNVGMLPNCFLWGGL